MLPFLLIRGHESQQSEKLKKIPKKDRIELAIKQEFESTVDPKLKRIPSEKLIDIQKALQRQIATEKRNVEPLEWEERGPDNVGGRTRAILIDKADNTGNTIFSGSVAGGIWKTTNAKAAQPVWSHVPGLIDNLAIGCLVQDPSNNSIMYAGTGEGYFNVDAQKGNGIWKTNDGGNSWSRLSSTANEQFNYIQKIGISNDGKIFACTRNNGVMRSDNAGASWTKVLGINVNATSDRAVDLIITTDNVIFVSLGIFSTDGIYRSEDLGDSWVKMTNGLPAGGYQRIALAGSAQNENLIYALYQDELTDGCEHIYKSTDQGNSWTELLVPQAYGMTNFARNQAWYNLSIAVDPGNQNRVIVGGIDLHMSENGGQSWAQISNWSGAGGYDYVHADQHAIVFEGNNSGTVFFGNDGGIARCQNIAASNLDIEAINTAYNVTQFYAGEIHPYGAIPVLLAGAQDNGTQRFDAGGVNSTTEVSGGDGSFCHIDRNNPDIQITSYVFNNYFISTDGGVNFVMRSFNNYGKFSNPSVYDPATQKLYAGNYGGTYFRWNDPAVAGNNKTFVNVTTFGTAGVSAIALSPNVGNRAYFGLDNGKIIRVENINEGYNKSGVVLYAGQTAYVSGIAIEEGNEDHLLVTFSNYGVESVMESTDGGTSWMNVEGDLPDIPVRWVVHDPSVASGAFVATQLGIWRTEALNGSSTNWFRETNVLNDVRVDMLKFRPGDNYFLAATHGRGLFTSTSLVSSKVNFQNQEISVSEGTDSGASGNCGLNNQILSVPVEITSVPDQNVNLNFSVMSGTTATNGKDYQIISSSMVFGPTSPLVQQLRVRILDEAIQEGLEVLEIKMNGPSEYVGNNDQIQILINDDDMDPTILFDESHLIGDGSGSDYNFPFSGYYEDERTQILYKAEELMGAGLIQGHINKLGINVSQKYSSAPFNNFTVKLKQVNMEDIGTAGSNFIAGATEVYSSNLSTEIGWNEFQLDQAFYWNGASDILVEFCFDNQNWSDDDYIMTSQSNFTSVKYTVADGAAGCSFYAAGTISNNRPDMRFYSTGIVSLADELCHKSSSLQQGDTAHFYYDDKLIASIENLYGGNITCADMEIDRIGNGIFYPDWLSGKGVTEKCFYVDAMYDVPYKISLYFEPEELSGWPDPLGLNMVKTPNTINEQNSNDFQLLLNSELNVQMLSTGVIKYTGVFSDFSGFALTDQTNLSLAILLKNFEVRKQLMGNLLE